MRPRALDANPSGTLTLPSSRRAASWSRSMSSDGFSTHQVDARTGRPSSDLNGWVVMSLVMFCGLFGLLGVAMIGFVGHLFVTDAMAYLPDAFMDMMALLTTGAVLSLFLACLGCAGGLRQTRRKGCQQGRRMLLVFWLCMVFFLVGTAIATLRLFVLTEALDLSGSRLHGTEMDKFERMVSREFNLQYAAAVCEPKEGGLFWDFVSKHCPDHMSESRCSGTSPECTTCMPGRCGSYTTDTIDAGIHVEVCPSEARCPDPIDPGLSGCPYVACRSDMLDFFGDALRPVVGLITFYGCIILVILALTCCTICYNPRLSIEQKLMKTGVAKIARKQSRTPRRGL